jgi:transposase
MGILGNIRQTAIHDHYHSYFTMDCMHGMCNAHHLRELTYVHEELGQGWAKCMIQCAGMNRLGDGDARALR